MPSSRKGPGSKKEARRERKAKKRAKQNRKKGGVPPSAHASTGPRESVQVEPSEEELRRWLDETPLWSFAYLDIWWGEAGCGWVHLRESEQIDELLGRFKLWERMTWKEILFADGSPNHAVAVEDISKAARDRLRQQELDDVEEIVSLRVTGKRRVWGIRHGRSLRLLWWDPDHQVWPSKLKHT